MKTRKQKEILDSLPNPSHGLLNLSPRLGKTKLGIDILKREKPKKILWVTSNSLLRDEDIPEEFLKWNAKDFLDKTDIICYASLGKHKGVYDKIILDEYQFVTEANSTPLFNGNIKYKSIIGFSGTHPRNRVKEEIYQKLNLRIISKVDINEAVEEGIIASYEIITVGCKLNSTDKYIQTGSKTKKFYTTEKEYYNYLTRRIEDLKFKGYRVPKYLYLNRMRFLYNLKSKTQIAKDLIGSLGGRSLVFTGSIAQAEKLSSKTFHSKTTDKNLKDFIKGKTDLLVCVNSGGIGHTFKNVDNLIMVQVNSDSTGESTQKIARSLVKQEGYKAKIYILYVEDTVDEIWKDSVLKNFNIENVKNISYEKEIKS